MIKNFLILAFLLVSLGVNAFSQDMISNEEVMTKDISAQEASKTALNVGAKMPSFNLSDSNGKKVNSDDLLKAGNLVVVFYRGAWCPFCNTYLRNLQKNLTQIKENGGNLVAISVENPDNSLTLSQKNKLDFTVLSDPNLDVARTFGIVYQLDAETNTKYKNYGIDLVKQNGTAKPELPLSATYIINQKGEIVYAFLEPDYTKRAEPSVIIETLKKLKSDSMKMDKMEKNK
ncbi:hypothetical protein BH10ACI1_BH10ACI1_25860 [soil metagenome]